MYTTSELFYFFNRILVGMLKIRAEFFKNSIEKAAEFSLNKYVPGINALIMTVYFFYS